MEKAKVLEAAKELNKITYENEAGEVAPLLEAKIKVVGIKEADLIEAFMSGCESVPEKLEQYIPDNVGEVYNTLVEEAKAKEAEATNTKSEKESAPTKEEKKKKGGFGNIEKNEYGHLPSKMSGLIDAELKAGGKPEDIAKKLGTDVPRVKNHINHLKKDRGVTFVEKDGSYKIK